MTPVTSLSVPTMKIKNELITDHQQPIQIFMVLPNLGVSLKTEPVRQRTVLLLGLAKLDLGNERLLRRL